MFLLLRVSPVWLENSVSNSYVEQSFIFVCPYLAVSKLNGEAATTRFHINKWLLMTSLFLVIEI